MEPVEHGRRGENAPGYVRAVEQSPHQSDFASEFTQVERAGESEETGYVWGEYECSREQDGKGDGNLDRAPDRYRLEVGYGDHEQPTSDPREEMLYVVPRRRESPAKEDEDGEDSPKLQNSK